MGLTEYYELSSDDGRRTAGTRPASILESWLQGKMERHDGIACELVQALDVLVPQVVEQLPNIVQFFATLLPVVVDIEVPKILPHGVPMRAVLRDTQLAEQLVEVPTIVSISLPQLNMEQNVDFPVPGGGQRRFLLQNAFLSGLWSRSLVLPVDAFKIFAQARVHPHLRTFQLVSMVLQMSLAKGIFAFFPKRKKCEDRSALGVRTECGLSIHPR